MQTQGTQSLSDEVWTHDVSLALLVKLHASKGQDLEELQSQSPVTALPDSGDQELARNWAPVLYSHFLLDFPHF